MDNIISPNIVLGNALWNPIDMIKYHVNKRVPGGINFIIGIQPNNHPHIGTILTLALSFVLAEMAKKYFDIESSLTINVVDNSEAFRIFDQETNLSFRKTSYHMYGSDGIDGFIRKNYIDIIKLLSIKTGVKFNIYKYSEVQSSVEFRETLIFLLNRSDDIKWFLAPSSGVYPVRIPCPSCNLIDILARKNLIKSISSVSVVLESYCPHHGKYITELTKDSHEFIDVNSMFRNLIKEVSLSKRQSELSVVIKSLDWVYGCQYLDMALNILNIQMLHKPQRIFTPLVLSCSGEKLSKSYHCKIDNKIYEWALNPLKFQNYSSIVEDFSKLSYRIVQKTNNLFRSYTVENIYHLLRKDDVMES